MKTIPMINQILTHCLYQKKISPSPFSLMTGPPFLWKKNILQFNLRTFSNITPQKICFLSFSLPIFPKVYSKLERSLDILPLKCGSFERKGKIALSIENHAVGHCHVLLKFRNHFANSQHCAFTTICLY